MVQGPVDSPMQVTLELEKSVVNANVNNLSVGLESSTRLHNTYTDFCLTKFFTFQCYVTKYMEIGRHRGMIGNEHIRIGINSYEKAKRLFNT